MLSNLSAQSIIVERVTKRFRRITIPKHTTLKDAAVSFGFLGRRQSAEHIVTAVDDVSFSVPSATTLGIVGRNGSGKTTLMRLLAGIYTPTSGKVRINGEVAPLLSLGVGFHPEMTGRENAIINGLVLGLNRKQIEERFDEIVEFSEISDAIDAPVRTYSSGMHMRLAFAVAVSVNPDIILLDEVLAVGDEAFAAKCLERIRRFKSEGRTIVLVSHDPDALLEWCDTGIWMDRGAVRARGTMREVIDAYHDGLASEERALVARA